MRNQLTLCCLLLAACGPVAGALGLRELTKDGPAPDPLVVIQAGPPEYTSNPDVSLSFATNTTTAIEGRLQPVGGPPVPFVAVTNPLLLPGLADGEYVFTARVASKGTFQEAFVRFTIDTVAPVMPGSPAPRIVAVTDTTLSLAWEEASDLGSGISAYEIHYALTEPPPVAVAGDFDGRGAIVATIRQDSPATAGNVTSALVAALQACKRYHVGISAVDRAGNRSPIVQAASRRTGCGGNGRFLRALDLGVTGIPAGIAAADFTGDGRIDLAVHGTLLVGGGDGTFAPRNDADIIANADVDAVDFDGDGDLDLVNARLDCPNDGAGGFLEPELGPPGPHIFHARGDFDRDGVPDKAGFNSDSPGADSAEPLRIQIQRRVSVGGVEIGRGSGAYAQTGFGGDFFVAIAVADFDRDGFDDLALAFETKLRIAIAGGTGGFGFDFDKVLVPTGDVPRVLLAADLDKDGYPDLALLTGATVANLRIYRNRRDGTFATPQVLTGGSGPRALVQGDFNADGIPDLAAAFRDSNEIRIYLGQGTGGVPSGTWTAPVAYAVGSGPVALASGDFNEDGILDLATANEVARTVTVLLGEGGSSRRTGLFRTTVAPELDAATGDRPRSIVALDLNGDAIADLAVLTEPADIPDSLTGQPSPSIVLLFGGGVDGQGDGTLGAPQILRLAGVAADDTGKPGLGGGGPFVSSNVTGALVAGDFDGDCLPDLLAFRGRDERLDINLFHAIAAAGRATGTFAEPVTDGLYPQDPVFVEYGRSGRTAADVDRDGRSDLLSLSDLRFAGKTDIEFHPEHMVAARFGRADGTLGAAIPSGAGVGNGSTSYPGGSDFCVTGTPIADRLRDLAVGDFDADGVLDVASVDELCPELRIWPGIPASPGVGSGAFTEPPALPLAAGSAPVHVVVGEFNGDRILDLAVVQRGAATVRIFLGNGADGIGDGTFAAGQSVQAGAGAMHATLGDFDGDHRLDLAVSNRDAGTVRVLLGNGDGTFRLERDYAVGTHPIATVTLDINADHVPDLAVLDETDRRVRVLLGVNGLE